MSQFRLRIASNGFVVFGWFEEELVLLGRTLTPQGSLLEFSMEIPEWDGGRLPSTWSHVVHKGQAR